MLNTDYLIGIPSGQIIDIYYKEINNLKQEGLISFDNKWMSYVFNDNNYYNILRYLKKPVPNTVGVLSLDEIMEFFDSQKKVRDYTLLADGIIDVTGDVYISGGIHKKIPFKFGKVSGDFIFKDCKLESLHNAPKEVGGNFIVNKNNLIDLEGGPTYVGKMYDCSDNLLCSLEGSPIIIYTDFDCSGNFLQDLIGAPKKIKGYFDCATNKLNSLDGIPECDEIIGIDKVKRKTEIIVATPVKTKIFKNTITAMPDNMFTDDGDGRFRW